VSGLVLSTPDNPGTLTIEQIDGLIAHIRDGLNTSQGALSARVRPGSQS
jgi:hypothetical protein